MYETTTGSKYDRNLSPKEIAKFFRAELKKAHPAVKASVTTSHNSIRVEFTAVPFRVLNAERVAHDLGSPNVFNGRLPWLSAEATALEAWAKAFLNDYNRDSSDIQSDYFNVHFYESICFSRSLTTAERAQWVAEFSAPVESAQVSFLRSMGVES